MLPLTPSAVQQFPAYKVGGQVCTVIHHLSADSHRVTLECQKCIIDMMGLVAYNPDRRSGQMLPDTLSGFGHSVSH